MSTEQKIRTQLAENPVLLYMKGTPSDPKCGFSRNAVEALKTLEADYAYVNVLEAPFIREKLPSISNWPTYPQLFIKGELVGGSDVVVAMVEDGSLKPMLDAAGGA
ncbi:Glutaredoxin-related protein [Marinobacterium lacunae]|uniref:Glutaredoxin n=1 Tax=Marinobacterium lacunae TaxID=1232683 RepID=A0A081FVL3_9GAMM|nr:Grx4 family monothiol glutaredoxin [Marinobacterium lacunae]KEA62568.1 Glutaredoxin-related protein [Marinobacterium lacunae]MBR9884043.1 Grx4 family monothiol glutaredoxin [Oceanospirillales bacterium]